MYKAIHLPDGEVIYYEEYHNNRAGDVCAVIDNRYWYANQLRNIAGYSDHWGEYHQVPFEDFVGAIRREFMRRIYCAELPLCPICEQRRKHPVLNLCYGCNAKILHESKSSRILTYGKRDVLEVTRVRVSENGINYATVTYYSVNRSSKPLSIIPLTPRETARYKTLRK